METTTVRTESSPLHFILDGVDVQTLGIKGVAYLDGLLDIFKDPTASNHLRFIWSHDAKAFAILLRDAMLSMLKLEQFQKDGLRTAYDALFYKNEIKHTLKEASIELQNSYDTHVTPTTPDPEEWIHQLDPSSLILEQIEELQDQIKKIQRSQHKLNQLIPKFEDYRELYHHSIGQRVSRLGDIKATLHELDAFVADEPVQVGKKKIKAVISKISDYTEELNNQPQLTSYEYIVVEDTNKLKVPVETDGGVLQYKSIDVLSEINGWTSFNMTSELRAVELQLQSYKETVLLTLQQLNNRLKARIDESRQIEEVEKSTITNPIQRLIDQYESEIQPRCIEKLQELKHELDTHIQVSGVFNKEYNFLPSSTLEQISSLGDSRRLGQVYQISKARKDVSDYFEKLSTTYLEDEKLTTAGFVNKMLCFDPQNDANALFLRRGYLGSSFTIDRKEIDASIDRHFNLWREGYAGGLLVVGGHNTGKSTVIEKIPLIYEDVQSYHFVPDQKIDVFGHKMIVRHDLIAALKFVVAHHSNRPVMVTVDNLEQYSNNPESAFSLIAEVLDIVQKHSKTIYFVVSMHTYLYEHFNHYFPLRDTFTEVVDTDYMPTTDIQEAVLIRSRAVANYDDILNTSDEYVSKAAKIAQQAHHNIGRAMQLWCMHRAGFSNMKGMGAFKKTVISNGNLLKTITKHGELYEPYLRSMLNDVDALHVKNTVSGLVRSRILIRPREGYISVNPYLRTTVELILNRKA